MIGRLKTWLSGQFVRDTIILQMGDTANLAVIFITSVLLARLLEPSGYGVYALIYALFGMLTVTGDLGLGQATVTQLAEALTTGDRAAAAEFSGYFLKLSALLGLVVLVVALAAGPWLAVRFYHNELIGWLSALLVSDMLLGLPRKLARIVWQAARMMTLLTVFEVARVVLKLALVLILLLGGAGVTGAILAEVAASAAVSLAAIPMLVRLGRIDPARFPGWSLILDQARRVPLGRHFAFGFKIVLDRNIGRVMEAAPFLILGTMASTATVGRLRVAFSAVNLSLNLLHALAHNLSARLPQLRAEGDTAGFWRLFFRSALAGGLMSLVGVGLTAALAKWLVPLIWGAQFAASVPLIWIISAGAAFSGFFSGLGALYRSTYRMGLVAGVNAAQMVIYLPLGWLAIRTWGTAGAAGFIGGRMLAMNLIGLVAALIWLRPR